MSSGDVQHFQNAGEFGSSREGIGVQIAFNPKREIAKSLFHGQRLELKTVTARENIPINIIFWYIGLLQVL